MLSDRRFARIAFVILALTAAMPLLATAQPAHAQSSQDMSLLSEQERETFNTRLQTATSSAERARITAEMNRLVQQRRLEQRMHDDASQQGADQGQKKGWDQNGTDADTGASTTNTKDND